MKIVTQLATVLTACAVMASASASAAADVTGRPAFDLTKFVYKGKKAAENQCTRRVNPEVGRFSALPDDSGAHLRGVENITPDFVIGPSYQIGDVDGPGGELWFYSMELTYDYIQHEYFVEPILRAYEVNIYDSNGAQVGSVKDKMHYADDEVRVPYCDILPVITSRFFNSDDKYEVVVGLAVNSNVPGVVRYRSVVYQLGGEKDSEGNDVSLTTLPDLVGDVLDASVPGGGENIYMTLLSDAYPDEIPDLDDDGSTALWDYMLASKMIVTIYGKADESGELQKKLTYDVCLQNLPGSQEDSPFMISVGNGNDFYYVFTRYGETLYNPYYTFAEDISQREENTLEIEVYKAGDTFEKVQSTTIPFVKDQESNVIASYYSVGDFRYRNDVNFTDFQSDGKAAFYVTKGNKVVGNDESLMRSYYVYNPDGTRRLTLFENSQSLMEISNIEGFEPQAMFVSVEDGAYMYNFVDLISGKQAMKMSYLLEVEDSDPEILTVNIDRAKVGEGYMYVDELRLPVEEDDNSYIRLAWFTDKGELDHIDEVNMGKNVHYAQSYLSAAVLNPDFYYQDATREYMVLIKRGLDNGAMREELLIGQTRSEEYPEGRDILTLLPDDQKGALSGIHCSESDSNPRLLVGYYNQGESQLWLETYSLPLGSGASIGSVDAEAEGDFLFDGSTVSAPGFIEVFGVQGVKVAEAENSLNTGALTPGLYIVKCNGQAMKLLVK